MNQLLFQREIGALSSAKLSRAVTHRALHELELFPWIRFDGDEKAPVSQAPGSSRQQAVDELFIDEENLNDETGNVKEKDTVWACQAGVSALDVGQHGHRL